MKTRILEKNGKFYPQVSHYCFLFFCYWDYVYDYNATMNFRRNFDTIEKAREVLRQEILKEKENKLKNKIIIHKNEPK